MGNMLHATSLMPSGCPEGLFLLAKCAQSVTLTQNPSLRPQSTHLVQKFGPVWNRGRSHKCIRVHTLRCQTQIHKDAGTASGKRPWCCL